MKKVVLYSGVLAAGLAGIATTANAAAPMSPKVNDMNAVNYSSAQRSALISKVTTLKADVDAAITDLNTKINSVKASQAYKDYDVDNTNAYCSLARLYCDELENQKADLVALQTSAGDLVKYANDLWDWSLWDDTSASFGYAGSFNGINATYAKDLAALNAAVTKIGALYGVADGANKLYTSGGTTPTTDLVNEAYWNETLRSLNIMETYIDNLKNTINGYTTEPDRNAATEYLQATIAKNLAAGSTNYTDVFKGATPITDVDGANDAVTGKAIGPDDYLKEVVIAKQEIKNLIDASHTAGTSEADIDAHVAKINQLITDIAGIDNAVKTNQATYDANKATFGDVTDAMTEAENQIGTYPANADTATKLATTKGDVKTEGDQIESDYKNGLYWDGEPVFDSTALLAEIATLRNEAAHNASTDYLKELTDRRTNILKEIEELEKNASSHNPAITNDPDLCNNALYTGKDADYYKENVNGKDLAENVAALEAINNRITALTANIAKSYTDKTSEADLLDKYYAEMGVVVELGRTSKTVEGGLRAALESYLDAVKEAQKVHEQTEAEYAKKLVDELAAVESARQSLVTTIAITKDECEDTTPHAGNNYSTNIAANSNKDEKDALHEDHEFEYDGKTLTYGLTNVVKGLDDNEAIDLAHDKVVNNSIVAKDHHTSKGYYNQVAADELAQMNEDLARTRAAWQDNQNSHKGHVATINDVADALTAADGYIKALPFYKDWEAGHDANLYCNEDFKYDTPVYAELNEKVAQVPGIIKTYIDAPGAPDLEKDFTLLGIMEFAYNGLKSLTSKIDTQINGVKGEIATRYAAGTSVEFVYGEAQAQELYTQIKNLENLAAFAQTCHEGYIFAHKAHLASVAMTAADAVCEESFDADETKANHGTKTAANADNYNALNIHLSANDNGKGIWYSECDQLNPCGFHDAAVKDLHDALRAQIVEVCQGIGQSLADVKSKEDYLTHSTKIDELQDKLDALVAKFNEVDKAHQQKESDYALRNAANVQTTYQALKDADNAFDHYSAEGQASANTWAKDVAAEIAKETGKEGFANVTTFKELTNYLTQGYYTYLADWAADAAQLHHSVSDMKAIQDLCVYVQNVLVKVQEVVDDNDKAIAAITATKSALDAILPAAEKVIDDYSAEAQAAVAADETTLEAELAAIDKAINDAIANGTSLKDFSAGSSTVTKEADADGKFSTEQVDKTPNFVYSDEWKTRITKFYNDVLSYREKAAQAEADHNQDVLEQHLTDTDAAVLALEPGKENFPADADLCNNTEAYTGADAEAYKANVNGKDAEAGQRTEVGTHVADERTVVDNTKTFDLTDVEAFDTAAADYQAAIEALDKVVKNHVEVVIPGLTDDVDEYLADVKTAQATHETKEIEANVALDTHDNTTKTTLAGVEAMTGADIYKNADVTLTYEGATEPTTVTASKTIDTNLKTAEDRIKYANDLHITVGLKDAIDADLTAVDGLTATLKTAIEKNEEAKKNFNDNVVPAIDKCLTDIKAETGWAIFNSDIVQGEGLKLHEHTVKGYETIEGLVNALKNYELAQYNAGMAADKDVLAKINTDKEEIATLTAKLIEEIKLNESTNTTNVGLINTLENTTLKNAVDYINATYTNTAAENAAAIAAIEGQITTLKADNKSWYEAGNVVNFDIASAITTIEAAITTLRNDAANKETAFLGEKYRDAIATLSTELDGLDAVCEEAFDATKVAGTRTGITYDDCDTKNPCAYEIVEPKTTALENDAKQFKADAEAAYAAGTAEEFFKTVATTIAGFESRVAAIKAEFIAADTEHKRLEDDAFDKVNREINVVYEAFLKLIDDVKEFAPETRAAADVKAQTYGYADWDDMRTHLDMDTFTSVDDIHSFTALRDKVFDDHDLHHSMEQREFNAKKSNEIAKMLYSITQPLTCLDPVAVEYQTILKNYNASLANVNLNGVEFADDSVCNTEEAHPNCYEQAVADASADFADLKSQLDALMERAIEEANRGDLDEDRRDETIAAMDKLVLDFQPIVDQFNDYIDFLEANSAAWKQFNEAYAAVEAQNAEDVARVNTEWAEDTLDRQCFEDLRTEALKAVQDEFKALATDTKAAADKAHHDAEATPADNYKDYGRTHTLTAQLEGLLETLNSYDVQDVLSTYDTEIDKLVKNNEAYTRLSDALAEVEEMEGSASYNGTENVVLWPGTENEVTVTTIPNLRDEIEQAWHPDHKAVELEEALQAKIDLLEEYITKNNEAYAQNQADLAALQAQLDDIDNPDAQASDQHEGASVVDYITNEKQAIQDMIDDQKTLIENDYKAGHSVDRDRQAEEDAIQEEIDVLKDHIALVNEAILAFMQDAQELSETIQNTIDALDELDFSSYVVVNEGLGVNEDHVAHVEAVRDYYVAQYQAQLDLIGTYSDPTALMQQVNNEYQAGNEVGIQDLRRTLLGPITVACENINAGYEKDMAQTDANIAAYRSFLADADEFFNTTVVNNDAYIAEFVEKYGKCVDTFIPYMEARKTAGLAPFEAIVCCTADPSFVPYNDLIKAIKDSKDGILADAATAYENTHAVDHAVPAVDLEASNDALDTQKAALESATGAFNDYVTKFHDFLENERVYRDLQTELNNVREAANGLDDHLQELEQGYTCDRCGETLAFDATEAIDLVDSLIAHLDRDGAGLYEAYKALLCEKNEQEWLKELAGDTQKVADTKAELDHMFNTVVDKHEQIHANEDAAGELIGNAIQGNTGLEAQWTQMYNATVNYPEYENDPFVQEVLDEYREKFVEVSREIDALKAQITEDAENNELATWNTQYAQDGDYAVVPGTAETRYLDIEAIQQELTTLVNEFNDAIDQAHIKTNAKDIYSDQYYFTVGFEMFNHIDVTEGATALVSDVTCTDIAGYYADLGVLVNGDKQNELTFNLDNGMHRNAILWTTLEAGPATAVIPAGAMTVDGFTTLHDVTINFNVYEPTVVDETGLNVFAVAGTNKMVIKVEKPVDATYTDKSLFATTDCGTISFADAQFNESDMTITFDIPEGAQTIELPEGFLTFRVGNNKISRSAAKIVSVVGATSIEAILAMGDKVEVFDLQGRRVSIEAIQKGQTYVIDGVKTFVK